jgi:putative transposase
MAQKYRSIFRMDSFRLKGYDYRNEGAYFITICTHHREHYFGECISGKMQLNEIGHLAHQYWDEIPNHFNNVVLGEFVVMPNHTHGIIIIDKFIKNTPPTTVEALHATPPQDKFPQDKFPQDKFPQDKFPQDKFPQDKFPQDKFINNELQDPNLFFQSIAPKKGSVSTIVRSYKSVVTKCSRSINPKFEWQSLFHDHIIRSQPEFDRVSTYIANNPLNWKEDRFSNK